MNGRIYDAKLGRFLQADPFVQAPTHTQSPNRYSYVINNPLNATDPSGYFFVQWLAGKIAKATGWGWIAQLASIASCVTGNVVACAGGTFAATYGYTGDFKASLKAGAIAAFSQWAGGQIAGGGTVFGSSLPGQALGFGIVGGTASVLGGGKFGHGFAAAGFSTLVGGNVKLPTGAKPGAIIGRVVIKAVIGGTASHITGGKFSNGAMTAAFSAIAVEGAAGNLESLSSQKSQSDKPDFENMTNEELTNWISENTEALGIDVAEGVSISVPDEYIGLGKWGYVSCEDSACGGYDPVYGDYAEGELRLFNHAFEEGSRTMTLPGLNGEGVRFVNANFTRAEHAVQVFGHEAAHSIGVDSYQGAAQSYHPNAEQRGYDAVQRFREIYGR